MKVSRYRLQICVCFWLALLFLRAELPAMAFWGIGAGSDIHLDTYTSAPLDYAPSHGLNCVGVQQEPPPGAYELTSIVPVMPCAVSLATGPLAGLYTGVGNQEHGGNAYVDIRSPAAVAYIKRNDFAGVPVRWELYEVSSVSSLGNAVPIALAFAHVSDTIIVRNSGQSNTTFRFNLSIDPQVSFWSDIQITGVAEFQGAATFGRGAGPEAPGSHILDSWSYLQTVETPNVPVTPHAESFAGTYLLQPGETYWLSFSMTSAARVVPEPTALVTLATGLGGFAALRRWRRLT
ncbi:MAG: PEP-CTERM sorting domain-containing protein [Armatimonadota bacterium]